MAHTKAKGTSKLGRDSASQRLGVKIFGGSIVKCGQIIIRQRGTSFKPGDNVKRGGDDTIYAMCDGIVNFKKVKSLKFTGNKQIQQIVSVVKPVLDKKPLKKEKVPYSETEAINEETFIKRVDAESKESTLTKTKSQYIKEEQPLKNIPQKRESKK